MSSKPSDESDSFAWFWVEKFKLAVRRVFKHWFVLLIVLGIATLLIIIRSYVVTMIPFWQSRIRLVTIEINIITDTFVALEDTVKIIVRIIQELRSLFSSKYTPPPFHVIKFKKIDDSEVHAVLSELVSATSEYNTGPKAAQFLFTYALNPYICPVVRASTPTVLDHVTYFFLSWMTVNPDPLLGVNSCQFDIEYISVHVVAAFFAFGYIIIEIIIPVCLGCILIYTLAWPTICTAVKLHERIITLLPETFGFIPVVA